MPPKLPVLLESLRPATARELRAVSFEGVVAMLTLDGITDLAPTLEGEWANPANGVPFRLLVLRLLARHTVFQSLSRKPVKPEFWESVADFPQASARRIAILACNLSEDERLWGILVKLWREDTRGFSRALALETMGTTGRQDPGRRQRTLAEYRHALASGDSLATLGALHGSLFFRDAAGDDIPRRVIGHVRHPQLVALAFAILLSRNPQRGPLLFRAIVDYITLQRPHSHGAAILLGVCALCSEAATRDLCHRVLAEPAASHPQSLRAGARYIAEHGRVSPHLLRRSVRRFPVWPAPA